MKRRHLLTAALAAPLARPALAQGANNPRVLRFVPHADLTVVDPSWSSAYITRNHAMMVYDTLWGTDNAGQVSYQMLEGHSVEADGRTWKLTLREGLKTGADKAAATAVGKLLAERALAAGIKDVVFDRGAYLYHGRVKALAEAAREGGLAF